MKRVVIFDHKIKNDLENVSEKGFINLGPLIGQCSILTDYVLHLAPVTTISLDDSLSKYKLKVIKDIKEIKVTKHAIDVSGMLPGGTWVLGIFLTSDFDVFNDDTSVVKSKAILLHLKNGFSADELMYGNSPSSNKLLLHYNYLTNKYTCKTLDVSSTSYSFKLVDFKFENLFLKNWYTIKSVINMKNGLIGMSGDSDIKLIIKDIVKKFDDKLGKTLVIFNNQIRHKSDKIKTLLHNQEIEATLYFPHSKNGDSSSVTYKKYQNELVFDGSICSKIYMNPDSTIEETAVALKQDIIRSLNHRLNLYWNYTAEDESLQALQDHTQPRRILIKLNSDSEFSFSDYLFYDEQQSSLTFSTYKQLLDLDVSEVDVYNMEKTAPTDIVPETDNLNIKRPRMGLLMLFSAFFIIVLALIIHSFN